MYIVQVYVEVKEMNIESFINATVENANNSIKELGIARFDVLQNNEDPTKFLLTEAYLDKDAVADHKRTEHYKIWKDTVANMMAKERTSVKYSNIVPKSTDGWKSK